MVEFRSNRPLFIGLLIKIEDSDGAPVRIVVFDDKKPIPIKSGLAYAFSGWLDAPVGDKMIAPDWIGQNLEVWRNNFAGPTDEFFADNAC